MGTYGSEEQLVAATIGYWNRQSKNWTHPSNKLTISSQHDQL